MSPKYVFNNCFFPSFIINEQQVGYISPRSANVSNRDGKKDADPTDDDAEMVSEQLPKSTTQTVNRTVEGSGRLTGNPANESVVAPGTSKQLATAVTAHNRSANGARVRLTLPAQSNIRKADASKTTASRATMGEFHPGTTSTEMSTSDDDDWTQTVDLLYITKFKSSDGKKFKLFCQICQSKFFSYLKKGSDNRISINAELDRAKRIHVKEETHRIAYEKMQTKRSHPDQELNHNNTEVTDGESHQAEPKLRKLYTDNKSLENLVETDHSISANNE